MTQFYTRPWRLLIFLRDADDPLWLLATITGPAHVLGDAATGPGDAAAWVAHITGGPVTLHLASAVVYRIDQERGE